MEMKKEQVEKHMVDNFGILHKADWDGNAHYEFKVDEVRKWGVTFYDDYILIVDNCGKIVNGHSNIDMGYHLKIYYRDIIGAQGKDFAVSKAYNILDDDADVLSDDNMLWWLGGLLNQGCWEEIMSMRFRSIKLRWWALKAKMRNWLERA